MHYKREKIQKHGLILVEFANAPSTDEAMSSYFKNIQSFLNFSPKFNEQIKKNFPFMSSFTKSLNETELELLDLILKEQSMIGSLDNQFGMLGYKFEGCDPKEKTLNLGKYFYDGGIFEGEPDVTTTVDGPYPMSIDEIRDEIEDSLHPDVPRHINELMEVGQSILNLKSEIPENRVRELYDISPRYIKILDLHEQIRITQIDYRNILEMIIEGAPLDKIPLLAQKFKIIYDSSKMATTKFSAETDCFEEIPLIDETNYIRNKNNRGWGVELQNEFAYWMVEFFRIRQSCRYIRKCGECKEFYISKTTRPSKWCSDKCRATYHSRKRIESGEHARYKRERIASGKATPSYYGPDPDKGKRK